MTCIDPISLAFFLKRDKKKSFSVCFEGLALREERRIVGNTLGSVEGLGRNGILKASLSIMYTLLNNVADYVVDQTFKAE